MDMNKWQSRISSVLFGSDKRQTPPARPSELGEYFVNALISEIIPKKALVESGDDLDELRAVNDRLALLELLVDQNTSNTRTSALRQILQPDNELRLEHVRELRVFEDPEVRYFLVLAAGLDIDPEFRTEAITTLLSDPREGELEYIRGLYLNTEEVLVRQAAIYAFEPAETPELRAILISQFPTLTPELRFSALQILKPYAGEADVQAFFDNAPALSKEERQLIQSR